MPGIPRHMSATMLTMVPPCFIRRCENSSRAIKKPPVRLVRTTVSQPFWLMASSGAGNWPPALLTSAWTAPRSAKMALIVSLTASSLRMSREWKLTKSALRSSPISPATRSSFSILRPSSTTWAPRLASSWAVQRPMPLPPPVTMMV